MKEQEFLDTTVSPEWSYPHALDELSRVSPKVALTQALERIGRDAPEWLTVAIRKRLILRGVI